jgi:hypothetical protein
VYGRGMGATLQFRDFPSNDEAAVVVRADRGRVGLAVSLRQDGDVEVFMPVETCKQLADALRTAIPLRRGERPGAPDEPERSALASGDSAASGRIDNVPALKLLGERSASRRGRRSVPGLDSPRQRRDRAGGGLVIGFIAIAITCLLVALFVPPRAH